MQHDELVQPLLRMMHDAVERFQKTIGDLTDISKLQQAHAQPPEAVDLAALVEDIRLDLAPALAAAGTHLEVDVATCPTLSFAPKNLRSILYNLLSNAIKYADPARPPVVRLRCARTEGTVVLEVQDNGLGLTEAQQRQLFIMFQRLHSHVEGSGVGLYMGEENSGERGPVVSRCAASRARALPLWCACRGRALPPRYALWPASCTCRRCTRTQPKLLGPKVRWSCAASVEERGFKAVPESVYTRYGGLKSWPTKQPFYPRI